MDNTTPTYETLRAMKGRGTKRPASDLAVGDVVRVEGMKYRVQAVPTVAPETGSLMVEVYSEDNQMDVLFLARLARVTVLGSVA